jgi:signal transduction histidine kinase
VRNVTSLRAKLTVLVAVPLVILVVVAAAAVRNTGDSRRSAQLTDDSVQLALAADDATLALIQERRLTVSAPGSAGLSSQRAQTDEALVTLGEQLDRGGRGAVEDRHVEAATETIGELPATRADIDGMTSADEVLAAYAEVLAPLFALDNPIVAASDPTIAGRQQAHRALIRLTDQVALEESNLASVFDQQELTQSTLTELTTVVANQEMWTEQFQDAASSRQLEGFEQLSSSQSATEAARLRDGILSEGPSDQVGDDGEVWATATDRKIEQLVALATDGATDLDQLVTTDRGKVGEARLKALGLLVAALALLALAAFALRRLVIEPIDRLASRSNDAADDIDAAVETGKSDDISYLERPGDDELDSITEAFVAAQEAVVSLVDDRAKAREEANEVFLNFGRRAQNLVTRQLGQIDDLETRTDDPDMLADLFLLDHLATRLRRTAESLVLLAGSESPRPWARPVSIVNVIRAAAAEASDYSRVDLAQVAPGAVTGTVANEVSHLLAELIDNALTYSPPESRVSISGERHADGRYIVSVSDAGLGMSAEQLDEANARLRGTRGTRSSAELPLSKFFGLHVAGRLAARHDIKVTLTPSPLNGITAAIGLPRTVMVLPTDGQSPALTQGPSRREEVRLPFSANRLPAEAPGGTALPQQAPPPPTPPPRAPDTGRRRAVRPKSAIAMPAAGTNDE